MNTLKKITVAMLIIGANIMSSAETMPTSADNTPSLKKFASFRTVCVGRFLIDLPKDFQFSYGDTRMSGVQISSNSLETQSEFARRLIERQEELSAIKDEYGAVSLEQVGNINMKHAYGKFFSYGRKRSYLIKYGEKVYSEWFSIEALVRVEENSYRLFVEYGDEHAVKKVKSIIADLRQRKDDELPQKEGFCFENGIVLGMTRPPEIFESTVLFAGHYDYPDLAVVLSSMSGITRQKSLLQRSADNSVRQQYSSAFQNICEGRRAIGAIPGEESSEKVTEKKGTRGHTYMWESDSVKEDVMKPFLGLELHTGIGRPGEPVNSSLSDEEVQALWDKISNSLRARPILPAIKDVPVTEAPSRTSAGAPCPRSGWWTCAEHADGYEVVGGITQYFAQGVRMPEAELLGPKKIFGRRTEFKLGTPTNWKFVGEQG